MKTQEEILQTIQQDIAELKKGLLKPVLPPTVSEKWVSRSQVMQFFNYAPTQMASLEKSGELIVTKVGKRKFILRDSITMLLDKNIQSNQQSD